MAPIPALLLVAALAVLLPMRVVDAHGEWGGTTGACDHF